MRFSDDDAQVVAAVVGCDKITRRSDHFRLKVENEEEGRTLVLEIYPETTLGRKRGSLVIVYAGNTHLQLHNCTGYVVSEELGEVTFVAESETRLSGLVIERGASCSQYAAIRRDLISSDFTQLAVEVAKSGLAMSMIEDVLSTENEAEAE